jgi:hypothetical protein
MKRDRSSFLIDWLNSKARKPLVIRGARQVGKTWLIRDLAKTQKKELIELNFEKKPDLKSLFSSNDPKEILINISAFTGKNIDPTKSILFLDEIQAAPELLSKLRWFAEDLSELPVIAAGSLLDFALEDHELSMPVGRIGYMYLEPLSFEEFLDAVDESHLRLYLQNYNWSTNIPDAIHNKLLSHLKKYLIIGGMPSAVLSWHTDENLQLVNQIHFDLLSTYRDDFAKYKGRLTLQRLEDIMNSIPHQLGGKFVYSNANPDISCSSLKQALDLLAKARICHIIALTSGNGLPLAAESNNKFFKVIMLDVGLCSASLGLSLHQLSLTNELTLINSGAMAEQLTGQILRSLPPAYAPPTSFYWQQTKKNSEAEIDYIIQHENEVIPIEVKAGKTGTLKSLHYFMNAKQKELAVRVNSDKPSFSLIKNPISSSKVHCYTLLSIPFYLLGQLHRLLSIAPCLKSKDS